MTRRCQRSPRAVTHVGGGQRNALVLGSGRGSKIASTLEHIGYRTRLVRSFPAIKGLRDALYERPLDILHVATIVSSDQDETRIAFEGVYLTTQDLEKLAQPPHLVFLSGRARDTRWLPRMAQSLLNAGVNVCIGNAWPVTDESDGVFVNSFYSELARGASIRDAVFHSRRELSRQGSADWGAFQCYGASELSLRGAEMNHA
jgi:CHAT domain-containing protein